MTLNEDSAWVFDSLVGFLQGPIWSAPLMTFVEEKSLIFEADNENQEEHHKLYQEYKNLVDLLLGCFMEDMGITPEQFEYACSINKHTKIPIQFQHSLFEQIWAANEYEIFKKMMVQKNLELQLQALNLIEQKYGLTPPSLIYESNDTPDEELVMETIIHSQVSKDSKDEPLAESLETSLLEEHQRLTVEYHSKKTLLEEALGTTSISNVPEKQDLNEFDSSILEKTIIEIPNSMTKQEDITERQNYLKARRDELVAMKKEARNQRFEMNNKNRPTSARIMAQATMKGEQSLEQPENLEPSILRIRKALADRLKAEVVHK